MAKAVQPLKGFEPTNKPTPKAEKKFSEMVIKEIMIQKGISHDEAKAHLEKYHK